MIAIALACDPELLIADEPTTVARRHHAGPDHRAGPGPAARLRHRGGVDQPRPRRDRAGRRRRHRAAATAQAVEQAPVLDVFDRPQQPYTRELLEARPLIGSGRPGTGRRRRRRCCSTSTGLDVRFPVTTPIGRSTVHAVKDLSFQIRRGTTLGLVGESGSGKSTVAAALTGLVQPDAGTATLDGADVLGVRRRAREGAAPTDRPGAPGSVRLAEPADAGRGVDRRAAAWCTDWPTASAGRRGARGASCSTWSGLPPSFASRYPHELSGGQRQRVSIARALGARARPVDPRRGHRVAGRVGAGAGARPAAPTCSASSA